MPRTKATRNPITVVVRLRTTVLGVAEWPALPDGAFFADTCNGGRHRLRVKDLPKSAREAIGDRTAHGGLKKGRLVVLFRRLPFAGRDPTAVAVMHLHLARGDPLTIRRIDFWGQPDDEQAQTYRRYLVACAQSVAGKLPWGSGRVVWQVSRPDAVEVVRALGFRVMTANPDVRGTTILYMDPASARRNS